MASGFTEYELMAAEWSRRKKLELKKINVQTDESSCHEYSKEARRSNEYKKSSRRQSRSRSRSPRRHSRSMSPQPRKSGRGNESESFASLYAPYDPSLAHRSIGFSGEVVGRDPAIDKSKLLQPRSRSRSIDRTIEDGRRERRRDSRSSSRDRRGRVRTPDQWTHDRYSERTSPSPVRVVPTDYRPPSPEWVSRAGGVAIMRKRNKKADN